MASVRQVAKCIGVDKAALSVVRDLFGFLEGVPGQVSLLTQIKRLQGDHAHLNLIRVGSDQFTAGDRAEIDAALQSTRDTYAQVNLGIGRIEHYAISTGEADGAENIDNDDEAEDLTNDWTVPNDALDIFFVLTYAGTRAGLSRVEGPCDKDAKGMDGSVVAIESTVGNTGQILAHEAAHYLGLEHVDNSNNLMFDSVPNGGDLTSGQGVDMRDHCFVDPGC
jgi:hypothetical protein